MVIIFRIHTTIFNLSGSYLADVSPPHPIGGRHPVPPLGHRGGGGGGVRGHGRSCGGAEAEARRPRTLQTRAAGHRAVLAGPPPASLHDGPGGHRDYRGLLLLRLGRRVLLQHVEVEVESVAAILVTNTALVDPLLPAPRHRVAQLGRGHRL